MLINEVISQANKFPLLEADLIKDKQPVEYKGIKYIWDDKNQHFTGGKYPRGVPQGEMLEYMILRAAGIVRRDGELSPTMMKRFSNNVKAQLKNPFNAVGDGVVRTEKVNKKQAERINQISTCFQDRIKG